MSVGILSVASTALQASYAQLQTIGHNIANVNTPGYSRQEVLLSTAGASFTGSGYLGRGVTLSEVQRRTDQFLTTELALSQSLHAADQARARELDRLQSLFADSQTGIGAAYDDWQLALADLANQPADPSSRTAALTRADTLTSRIRSLDDQLSAMHSNMNERLAQSTVAVNSLLDQLARINGQIASSAGRSKVSNDLLDQRDQLIEKISHSLRVNRFINQDNTASLFTVSGQALVLGTNANRLDSRTDPDDPSRQQVVLDNRRFVTVMDSLGLGGGELAGILRARDEDLTAARASLGQIAGAIAARFNQQQARGVDPTGSAGAPLFAEGQARAIASGQNTGSGIVSVGITDATQLYASDYTLSFDGSQYSLIRHSDGLLRNFSTLPASVDGLDLSITGTPSTNDRFTVKAASELAAHFKRVLANASGIATAYSMTAQSTASNQGDVQVQGFDVQAINSNSNAPVTLTFTSATGFNVSGTGTGNPSGVSYVAGQPISYNGWQLRLSGVPRAGDTITISATASLASDNRNARAMLNAAQSGLVNGRSVTDSYAILIADVGTRAQSADAVQNQSKRVLDNASAAWASESGVNLDEEAARLLQYQQAYQAAAKLMATAQSMFESLLAATSR